LSLQCLFPLSPVQPLLAGTMAGAPTPLARSPHHATIPLDPS
jgi:hypothetical protein